MSAGRASLFYEIVRRTTLPKKAKLLEKLLNVRMVDWILQLRLSIYRSIYLSFSTQINHLYYYYKMVPTNIEPFNLLGIWVRLFSIFLYALIWEWKNLKKKKSFLSYTFHFGSTIRTCNFSVLFSATHTIVL